MESVQIELTLNTVREYKKREEQHPIMEKLYNVLKKSELGGYALDVDSKNKTEQITLDKKNSQIHIIIRKIGYILLAHFDNSEKGSSYTVSNVLNNILHFFSDSKLLKIKNIEAKCTLMLEKEFPIFEMINAKGVNKVSKQEQMNLMPLGVVFATEIEEWSALILAFGLKLEALKQMKMNGTKELYLVACLLSKDYKKYDEKMIEEIDKVILKIKSKTKKGAK